jgi:hypothetical protein
MMTDLENLQKKTEYGIVEGIDTVVKEHERDVARALYKYCEHCTDTSNMMENLTPELRAFLAEAYKKPESKGLPLNAYMLAPIQRIARYPMLLDEIARRSPDGSAEEKKMLAVASDWSVIVLSLTSAVSPIVTCEKRSVRRTRGIISEYKCTWHDRV